MKQKTYVLVLAESDVPDYFKDETSLWAMNFHNDPGAILVNVRTGSVKIRHPGRKKATTYMPNYLIDKNQETNSPSMTHIFEFISSLLSHPFQLAVLSGFILRKSRTLHIRSVRLIRSMDTL